MFSSYTHKYSALQVFWSKENSWYSWPLFTLCFKAKYRSTHPEARAFDCTLPSLAKQPHQKSRTPEIPMRSTGKFKTKLDQSLHASAKIHRPLFRLLAKQAALQGSLRTFSLPEKTQLDRGHNDCTMNLSWRRQEESLRTSKHSDRHRSQF